MLQLGVSWTYCATPQGKPLPYRVRCRDCGACIYFDEDSRDLARAMMRKHVLKERAYYRAEAKAARDQYRDSGSCLCGTEYAGDDGCKRKH